MRRASLFANMRVDGYDVTDRATVKGVVLKTSILFLITVGVAIFTGLALPVMVQNNPSGLTTALIIASVLTSITAIVGMFVPKAAKISGCIYSIGEGFSLGSLSALLELFYPGISVIAVFSTLIIFGVALILFATGVIRNENLIVSVCTGMFIGALALSLFIGIGGIFYPVIFQNIGLCIALDAFFLIYGMVTLNLDFLQAKYLIQNGAPKEYEWGVSLRLQISLVYIYIQVLSLLADIFASRD